MNDFNSDLAGVSVSGRRATSKKPNEIRRLGIPKKRNEKTKSVNNVQ